MAELEISICSGEPQAELQPILDAYQTMNRVTVDLRFLDWSQAWTEFLQMTLYERGPVISETGTTWMNSLAGRNSLRIFTREEVRRMGGAGSYPRSIWESCVDPAAKDVVAIPWIVDTYLIYYRADLLAQAGVEETSAFSTLDNFRSTLEKLQARGEIAPLALPTAATLSTMHNLASWIWGMGGEFVSREGNRLGLDTPEAREAILAFYNLIQFIPPSLRNLTDEECEAAFLKGECAVIVRNPSLLHLLKNQEAQPAFHQHIKTAVHPGVPLIGGSNLVIWKYIPPALESKAVDLIRYLTEVEAQTAYFEKSGNLPARLDAIQRISQDPDYAPAFQSLIAGRDLPYIRLWGLIEDKLSRAFSDIWHNILYTPEPDIKRIVEDTLTPVERRLNITLSQ